MISKAQLDHRRYPSEIKLIMSSYPRDIDNAVRWSNTHQCFSRFWKTIEKNAVSYKDWKKSWFLKFSVRILYTGFRTSHSNFNSLVSRPVRVIRVSARGLEPSAIAQAKNREQGGSDREWPLPTGNVTSEIAQNNLEPGFCLIDLIHDTHWKRFHPKTDWWDKINATWFLCQCKNLQSYFIHQKQQEVKNCFSYWRFLKTQRHF